MNARIAGALIAALPLATAAVAGPTGAATVDEIVATFNESGTFAPRHIHPDELPLLGMMLFLNPPFPPDPPADSAPGDESYDAWEAETDRRLAHWATLREHHGVRLMPATVNGKPANPDAEVPPPGTEEDDMAMARWLFEKADLLGWCEDAVAFRRQLSGDPSPLESEALLGAPAVDGETATASTGTGDSFTFVRLDDRWYVRLLPQ
jgi:hypothetical protein